MDKLTDLRSICRLRNLYNNSIHQFLNTKGWQFFLTRPRLTHRRSCYQLRQIATSNRFRNLEILWNKVTFYFWQFPEDDPDGLRHLIQKIGPKVQKRRDILFGQRTSSSLFLFGEMVEARKMVWRSFCLFCLERPP